MCIVTFLPLSGESFILTSSREEIPARVSEQPTIHKVSSVDLLYPKDIASGGSWIVASSNAKTACLLNGAFDPYTKQSSYKHSRGLIPLKYLNHKSFLNFYFQYDLSGVEPFTLIAFEDRALFELRWDGKKAHVKTLVHKTPHIWSSVTLYDRETILERENRFREWCSNNPFEVEKAISFHKAEEELVNNNRKKEVQTLSITSLYYSMGAGVKMIYEDKKTGARSLNDIKF